MKKITISLEEEAFLFYQRVAFVLESSTELVIADYLTKLSEIMIDALPNRKMTCRSRNFCKIFRIAEID